MKKLFYSGSLAVSMLINSSVFADAKTTTIEQYFTATNYQDFLQKQSIIKDNYYRALAEQQVMYHLKNFELTPEDFSPQQQRAVEELVRTYKQFDPEYRTAQQEYQYQIKRYQQYFSEDSLQYFIQHSKSDSEQALIAKNNINMLYQSMLAPNILTDYLNTVHFSQTVFEDILKIRPKPTEVQP